jgi:hypothetical protein
MPVAVWGCYITVTTFFMLKELKRAPVGEAIAESAA